MMNGYPDPLQGMEYMRPSFSPMQMSPFPGLPQAPPMAQGKGPLSQAFAPDGGLLGFARGLLGDGSGGFGLLGNRGMMTTNGGIGGTNPFTGHGWGSMAPGGQTTYPGGYQGPTDTLNLPF